MHLQNSVPGWTNALVQMPDGYLLKAVNDAGILADGLDKWTAAGRDPDQLVLDYRHHDLYLPQGDWESLKAQWRAMFFRFVDRTWLERYAPIVTLVEENNEYFTNEGIREEGLGKYINSARAAVAVWNGEFRGRRVTSPDGGTGTIHDDCRLVLANGFVTHDIPREYYQLAVSEDAVIGYHNYTRYQDGARAPDDWANHSGRVFRLEQAYGLKPDYAFTECGPYNSADNGWRHSSVLGGNVTALVEALRRVVVDMQATAAYAEGRILGPGAFFTTGAAHDWPYYELETPQLLAIAAMLQDEWKPGDDDMSNAQIRELADRIITNAQEQIEWAEEIKRLAPVEWWDKPAPYSFRAQPVNPLKLYRNDRVTVYREYNYTGWVINVFAVDPAGWLKVSDPTGDESDLWLRAGDVQPVD